MDWDVKDPLTSERLVAELAADYGLVLGNEFLEYLELNNGGQILEPEGFRGPNGEAHSVTDFMSQKQIRDEYLNIWIRVSSTRENAEKNPEYYLPIAENGFGDQLLIGCHETNKDKVYFLIHDRPQDFVASDVCQYGDNPFLVSDSFKAFLDSQ